MAATLEKGPLFPASLITEMYSKVKGKSSIAKLCAQTPIPFNGSQIMTFSMDSDVNIVAESGQQPAGGTASKQVLPFPVRD